MRFSRSLFCGFAATALASITAGAFAQAPQVPGAPTDVKIIGDYQVRCFPVKSQSPCDMYEELDDKNSRQRVLGFSLAYMSNANRYALQIAVPLGVSIPKGVVIQTDNFTSSTLHYRRCDRGGCYVEMMMDKASIDSLAQSGPDAKIKIVADNDRSFDLRFSLNGFSSAYDAMVQLTKAKATTPTAAAPEAVPAQARP